MDHEAWKDRWKRREIGFHQPHVHDQLKRLWPAVAPPSGSTVFVPLAGKSRDMVWLAERGHEVVGVELSEIAVGEFFDELALTPDVSDVPGFKVYRSGPYTLYCGDIFALPAEAVANTAAVYDRAALIAFAPDMQPIYAQKLRDVLPPSAAIFLISMDYPRDEITGPPFAVPEDEINQLFDETFTIEKLESRDGLVAAAADALKKRGVTRLEEAAYLLRRRA